MSDGARKSYSRLIGQLPYVIVCHQKSTQRYPDLAGHKSRDGVGTRVLAMAR